MNSDGNAVISSEEAKSVCCSALIRCDSVPSCRSMKYKYLIVSEDFVRNLHEVYTLSVASPSLWRRECSRGGPWMLRWGRHEGTGYNTDTWHFTGPTSPTMTAASGLWSGGASASSMSTPQWSWWMEGAAQTPSSCPSSPMTASLALPRPNSSTCSSSQRATESIFSVTSLSGKVCYM